MWWQANFFVIIKQLNKWHFRKLKEHCLFVNNICRIYVPIKKEFPHKFRNISKKMPHFYRIIFLNHHICIALFWKITACLPHVYRIFSFLKHMRHRIILEINTTFKYRLWLLELHLWNGVINSWFSFKIIFKCILPQKHMS